MKKQKKDLSCECGCYYEELGRLAALYPTEHNIDNFDLYYNTYCIHCQWMGDMCMKGEVEE